MKILAYVMAALAGAGLIYVPHEMFYDDPSLFFLNMGLNIPS